MLVGAASTLLSRPLLAEDPIPTLSLQPAASRIVPVDYVGFSYETAQLADSSFFAEDNHLLVVTTQPRILLF